MSSQPIKTIASDFKVDKSIIRHLIFSQAGTLVKALIELIMNSLDAKSSAVHVNFSEDMSRVVVEDDGVGFTSVEDITELFGTFGFDHQTQAELARGRDYGRFGLGRAQCLAFGSTIWKTNRFSMEVELKGNKTNDLPYIIKEHNDILHAGCSIELSLYKHMSVYDKRNLISDLKRMAKYVRQDLFIDGELINQPVDSIKWSAENEDFLFLNAKSERGLNFYNKGVFVCYYPHSKFGVSGDISSKDNFKVNMARNDVLVAECDLWKAIPAFLKPFAEKKERNVLTDQDRIYLLSQVLKGELFYSDIQTKRIFMNADGKYFTLKQVYNHAGGYVTIAPDRRAQHKGMGLHRRKIAFCFSYDFADKYGFKNLEEMFVAIRGSMVSTDYELDINKFQTIDFKAASETVLDNYDIIPNDELGELDKVRLKATESLYQILLKDFVDVERNTGRVVGDGTYTYWLDLNEKLERRIAVGRSEMAKAWTDGSRYIAVDIEFLRTSFDSGLNGFINLASVLLHEQCHEGASSCSHDHDGDFYEHFHDVITNKHFNLFTHAARALESYMSECKKNKRPLNRREVSKNFSTMEKLLGKTV